MNSNLIGIIATLLVGLGLGYLLFSGGGMLGGTNMGGANMGGANMGGATGGGAMGGGAMGGGAMGGGAMGDGANMGGGAMGGDHAQMMQQPAGAANAATTAFQAANQKMHMDMAIVFTGDADVDFVTGMIPHHQGAIDMAKVVIEHGHDAQINKLAEGIIAAQESEIAFMKDWLAKNKH
jgi:hypothetical protein